METGDMETTDHRKLAEIGRVRIYGTKFHNLPKDARVRVANRLGDKITRDTVKAAIDEVNGKRKMENGK